MDCTCPYCDKEMDDPDDCYEPNKIYQHECPNCEKNFVFTIDYIRCYSENKADCLNGSEHKWEKTITFPVEFTRLYCTDCGEERPLPKETA
jgi:hypothetical protein